jgi:hypothetical protein
MLYSVIKEPWPHIINDDTYDESLFAEAQKELVSFIENMEVIKDHYNFNQENTDFQNTFPKALRMMKSKTIIKNFFPLFTPQRKFKKGAYIDYSINICKAGAKYKLHDENPRKILSTVTYLSPKSSIGTHIYDKDKNYVKDVEWKENRTLIFAPIDNVTWHDFEATQDSHRITLNTVLMNKRQT